MTELQTGRLVQARTRKLIRSPNHARKNPKVKLYLKNLAMLLSYSDYIFVQVIQKARLRCEFLSTFEPDNFVKFRPEPVLKSPARLTTLSYELICLTASSFVAGDITRGGSRGHKARGQGHKKNPRPKPRTDTLEAKDSNARGQGQGPRTQAQVLSKKKKKKKVFTKIF